MGESHQKGGGGANVAKFDVFLMQMMQGFLADDASDALVFGKEPLPKCYQNLYYLEGR